MPGKARYLVQDIETIPESEIEAYRSEDSKAHGAFPPIQYHKIICIGMLVLDENLLPIKAGCAAEGLQGGKGEKEMIRSWSNICSGKPFAKEGPAKPLSMVDWHGRGFDVPVLQTRAFRYGVKLPWYFGKLPDNKGDISSWSKSYRDRYGGQHVDLAEWWTNTGAFQRPHMANLAMLFGLPGKVGIDGSKVHDAYLEGQYAEIDIYCMQDVFQTAFIMQRAWYMAGEIGAEGCRDAAKAMLEMISETPGQKEFFDSINQDAVFELDE